MILTKLLSNHTLEYNVPEVVLQSRERTSWKKSLWNKDIPFLKQAKYLNDEGYTVLMYDMRNHGNSERTDWITWGLKERKDIVGALNFISNHNDYTGCQYWITFYLYGASN